MVAQRTRSAGRRAAAKSPARLPIPPWPTR